LVVSKRSPNIEDVGTIGAALLNAKINQDADPDIDPASVPFPPTPAIPTSVGLDRLNMSFAYS
jgi:hypothetical protein